MIQKKICLLGTSAVGKTSLVRRFVHGLFDDRYLTTIGVKIDRRAVEVDGRDVNLVVWDINGEDDFQRVQSSYFRGMAGYLLVVDGTRSLTLDRALALRERIRAEVGEVPFLLCLNKADLKRNWDVDEGAVERLEDEGHPVLETSAKTGQNVAEAFQRLAALALAPA